MADHAESAAFQEARARMQAQLRTLESPEIRAFIRFKYELTVQAKDGSFVGQRARGNRRRRRIGLAREARSA